MVQAVSKEYISKPRAKRETKIMTVDEFEITDAYNFRNINGNIKHNPACSQLNINSNTKAYLSITQHCMFRFL